MVSRKIVQIDEELCNGCGQCIPNCAEGALQIVDGKARIVKDVYCDGLGACLGQCPQDAISIIEREADPFDEEAVHMHLTNMAGQEHPHPLSCPSATALSLDAAPSAPQHQRSALRQWPVQLNLVPLKAPFFEDADLLVMADCVPVAYPNLHGSLISGRTVMIGCPKFDNAQGYIDKLGEILRRNSVRSITVAHMEVPCCSGLNVIVDRAVKASGKDIPVRRHMVTVRGELQ